MFLLVPFLFVYYYVVSAAFVLVVVVVAVVVVVIVVLTGFVTAVVSASVGVAAATFVADSFS